MYSCQEEGSPYLATLPEIWLKGFSSEQQVIERSGLVVLPVMNDNGKQFPRHLPVC